VLFGSDSAFTHELKLFTAQVLEYRQNVHQQLHCGIMYWFMMQDETRESAASYQGAGPQSIR
jgi:hypothetical protein